MATVALTFTPYTGGIYTDADNYATSYHFTGGAHFQYYQVYLQDENEYDLHANSFFGTSIYVHSGTTNTTGLGLVYDQGGIDNAFINDWSPPSDGTYTVAVFHDAGYYYDYSSFTIYEDVGGGTPAIRTGTAGADSLTLTAGNDTVIAFAGADTVWGMAGDDLIYGNQSADLLSGGAGSDTIFGGQDIDIIVGGDAGDVLYGNLATDIIAGDAGNDTLYGGQGNDFLNGGVGNDVLFGNLHSDYLIFNAGAGQDTAYGFSVGEDSISLNGVSLSSTTATANGVLLTWSDGGSVQLIGVLPAQISEIVIS